MRSAVALAALLLPACISQPTPIPPIPFPEDDARTIWLGDHNRERAAVGSPPLAWDVGLERQAYGRARELALLGRLVHSSRLQRPDQGENLWMGTRGSYRAGTMTGAWAGERSNFRRGTFPNVSRTGDWSHVGHYTQMVWPTTTRLGCGLASSPQWDVLVCRYSPPGNRDGDRM